MKISQTTFRFIVIAIPLALISITLLAHRVQKMKTSTDDFENAIVTLTAENFNEFINEKLVLVDFWAPWCYPCRLQNPILEELNNETEKKYRIGKLNVDENASISKAYGITSIPTLLIFKEGKVVDRLQGLHQKDQLKAILLKHSAE